MSSIVRLFLVVLLLAVALGWLISEYDHLKQDLQERNRLMALERQQVAELSEALQAIAAERDAYRSQAESLGVQLAAAQSEAAGLQQQMAAASAHYEQSIARLEAEAVQLRASLQSEESEVEGCQQALQLVESQRASEAGAIRSSGMAGSGSLVAVAWIGLAVGGGLGVCGLFRLAAVQQRRRLSSRSPVVLPIKAGDTPLSLRPQGRRRLQEKG